jgi:predicted metal-dependent hydrolase
MSNLMAKSSTNINTQVLQYGDMKIYYQVFFVISQKPKIIIDVLHNGTVHVKAPISTPLTEVKVAVHKRARWIYNHVEKIKLLYAHVLPRLYVSGESHYYLGKRYLLKVIQLESDNQKYNQQVKLIKGQLQIYTVSNQVSVIKVLLAQWYRQHALKIFERRINALASRIIWLNNIPKWRLHSMKKQWGSCSPQKIISLNPSLIKAPRECIDYVIYHEICHIKEHNHSKQFYALLTQFMPDWKIVKAKLDSMSELLLAE